MTNQFAVPFNQDAAMKAGGGDFIQDGGAYALTITSAKYITAGTGSRGMEFEVKTDAGQTAKYITIYFQKADNSTIPSGYSTLCGIMYFLGLEGLTVIQSGSDTFAPELAGKRVGLFLQKVLYSKNAGGDGYKFDIRAPFNPDGFHTVKEANDKTEAKTINNWTAAYKDKDDRKAPQQAASTGGFGNDNTMPHSDDIPW